MKPRSLSGVMAMAYALLSVVELPAQTTSFVHEDGTTHWYQAVLVPTGITFDQARARAAEAGGYLATITSSAEAIEVFGMVDRPAYWTREGASLLGPWIGGVQVDTSDEPAGGWGWGELEPFVFTAWTPGQPDNSNNADRICLGGATTLVPTWADVPSTKFLNGYVVEFSGPTVLRTVGLLQQQPGSFEGYTLFSPLLATSTFLVDARGRVVNEWKSDYTPGTGVYLEPTGHVLRAGRLANPAFQGFGGDGGIIEEFDWDGNTVWEFRYSTPMHLQHHDMERLPNGNVLLIAWEKISGDLAIAAGRAASLLPAGEIWPDKIVEVEPIGPTTGRVVWEWRAWDHVVQDIDSSKENYGKVEHYPERIDLNYTTNSGAADWLHFNAIAYNAALDQIVVSSRNFSEIWIIDHSTTTAEAASSTGGRSGKGGDLLYRWGNPQVYRAGTATDRTLYWQHDAHWVADGLPGAGNMMVFNNGGMDRPGGTFSSVEELVLPAVDARGNYPRPGRTWGPAGPVWSFVANPPTSFYSQFVSGSQRLPNGNTLICGGWIGSMFEVTAQGQILRSYTNPINGAGAIAQGTVPGGNMVFRGPAYAPDYPALRNRALVPDRPLESHATVLLADGSTAPRQAALGTSVQLDVRAQAMAGSSYLVLTSITPGLLPVDYRMLRLAFDGVTDIAATGLASAVFQNYFGRLDVRGRAVARLSIPNLSLLAGVTFYSAFVGFDFDAPSTIGVISNTVEVNVVR